MRLHVDAASVTFRKGTITLGEGALIRMHLFSTLLKKRFAVVSLVVAAAVLGSVGLLGYLYQYTPPTTYVFSTNNQVGAIDADGDGTEGRTVTRLVNGDDVPVLSMGEPWPFTGSRCGPGKPTEVQTEAWLNGSDAESRVLTQLFPTNPIALGSEHGGDDAGNAKCLYFNFELQPDAFSQEVLQAVERRGELLVELVFDNHMAVDGSTAPQSQTSESFIVVSGDPGARRSVTVPADSIDFDPATLALEGSTSNEGPINRLGLISMILAGLALLLIPVAALLPTRDALKAERDARSTFFTANPDPILTATADGRITRHSPAIASLFGEDTLEGRKIYDFVPDFDPVLDLTDGDASQTHAQLIRQDGSTLPVDISHMHTEIHGQEQQVAVVRDATSRLQAQSAELEIAAAEAQASTAAELLAASHHSLNREILGIGFALDDLVDDPSDDDAMDELKAAYALLEQGRDELYAIGTLSKYEVSPTQKTVTAEQLRVVGHEGIRVECETVEPLVDVDPLILRLAITNAARNGATHGGATLVRITTFANALQIDDDGGVTDDEALQRAWVNGERPNGTFGQGLQIIQRCARASNGVARIIGTPDGATVTIDFHGGTERDLADRRRIPVGN